MFCCVWKEPISIWRGHWKHDYGSTDRLREASWYVDVSHTCLQGNRKQTFSKGQFLSKFFLLFVNNNFLSFFLLKQHRQRSCLKKYSYWKTRLVGYEFNWWHTRFFQFGFWIVQEGTLTADNQLLLQEDFNHYTKVFEDACVCEHQTATNPKIGYLNPYEELVINDEIFQFEDGSGWLF